MTEEEEKKLRAELAQAKGEAASLRALVNKSREALKPFAVSYGALFADGRQHLSGTVVAFEDALAAVAAAHEDTASLPARRALVERLRSNVFPYLQDSVQADILDEAMEKILGNASWIER